MSDVAKLRAYAERLRNAPDDPMKKIMGELVATDLEEIASRYESLAVGSGGPSEERLRDAIEKALETSDHTRSCISVTTSEPLPCDCWRSVLVAAQPQPPAEQRWGTHYDTIPHGPGSCDDPGHCDCDCVGCVQARGGTVVEVDADPTEGRG